MKTAFFGGSFNPPHAGHLGAALGALRSGRTGRILWAPGFAPPHKTGRSMASFADRMEMCRLLIAGTPSMELCDIEARCRFSPSYTFDVLEVLARERPGDELQLLIGGDSLRDLHCWHRARELAERYEILTYPRRGKTPDAAFLRARWPPESARKLAAGVLDGKFFEISSTNLRNRVAKSDETGHIICGAVPEPLAEFIRSRRLYSNEETTS